MSTANKISLISDRVERAKSLLLSQFRDKPNINALVDALVSELQELENVVANLQTVRTLEGAYGWWLDKIGEELDIARGNYADNDYKTAIKIAMAKQTASASVDDILRIVQLITADTQAELMNPSHYVLELWSYLFCVSDSQEGLDSLAKLFPLNTRVRLVQHEPSPFKFATAGRGFSAGSLNNLVYSKAGHTQDPRFVTIPTQDLPPAVVSSPTVITNPYIYGDNYVGGTLILNAGVYDGDEPLVYMYQWLKDGFDIPSATANTYTLVSGDESKVVSCRVNVSNAYGNIDTYSNQMLIEATIPAPSPMVTDANLHDHFTSEIATGPTEPATNISRIRFNSDGTLDYMQDTTVLETLPYLVTTGAGAGNDYKVIYSVVDGTQLSGLNQNAAAPLSSAVTVSLSVTGTNALKTGTYNFTIFKASDPSISESKTIVISTSVSL